jgi:hypothetical protein
VRAYQGPRVVLEGVEPLGGWVALGAAPHRTAHTVRRVRLGGLQLGLKSQPAGIGSSSALRGSEEGSSTHYPLSFASCLAEEEKH